MQTRQSDFSLVLGVVYVCLNEYWMRPLMLPHLVSSYAADLPLAVRRFLATRMVVTNWEPHHFFLVQRKTVVDPFLPVIWERAAALIIP